MRIRIIFGSMLLAGVLRDWVVCTDEGNECRLVRFGSANGARLVCDRFRSGPLRPNRGWLLDRAGQLPTSLGGCSVTVNGTSAMMHYASPGQINFIVPGMRELDRRA